VDEGRKRVIGIIAGILVAKHMDVADDLFGGPQGSPRTGKMIADAVQWVPANREFNRESCKFWGPKTALLISKLYISEGNKRFRHKPEQGICRNVSGNRIQLSAPCSIDPRDVRGPCVLAGENPNCSRCSTQFKGIPWHNLSKFRS